MKFHIGDPVMHWTCGFGRVVAIEERALGGQQTLYYEVKVNDLSVWVPADDQLSYRLRIPSSADEFKNLFAILTRKIEPLPENRQERKIQLVERLKDGQANSLCSVIRDLSGYQKAHSLNETDQNLMKRTRAALLSEWGYALSVSVFDAELKLSQMLTTGMTGEPSRP